MFEDNGHYFSQSKESVVVKSFSASKDLQMNSGYIHRASNDCHYSKGMSVASKINLEQANHSSHNSNICKWCKPRMSLCSSIVWASLWLWSLVFKGRYLPTHISQPHKLRTTLCSPIPIVGTLLKLVFFSTLHTQIENNQVST